MINIFSCGGKIFVWNVNDVIELRKKHRIVGALAGIYPNRPFQIQTKWLPLQLMQEEAYFLIEKGIAKLLCSPDKITDPKLIQAYFEQRDKLCEEQVILLKENRKKIILEKADEIYEGKKRKFMEQRFGKNKKIVDSTSNESFSRESNKEDTTDSISSEHKEKLLISSEIINTSEKEMGEDNNEENGSSNENEKKESNPVESCELNQLTAGNSSNLEFLDKQTVIESELAKVLEVDKDLCMVQLFTECPWKNLTAVKELNFPSTDMEKLRYAVFKDLWEKNHYITNGMKFGGDFLAYEGDPLKYHAAFIIVCIPHYMKMQAIDLLTYGRLGHQVKKTFALASFNEDGNVDYISVQWANDIN